MVKLTVETRRRRVQALRAEGLSLRAIAARLGVSHELVRRDVRAVGLTVLTAVPDGLGPRGADFWRHTQEAYELDRDETELLVQACRLLDRADELRADVAEHGVMLTGPRGSRVANPALAAERAVSLAVGKLLNQLDLPAPPDPEPSESPDPAGAPRTRNRRSTSALNKRTHWRTHGSASQQS